MPAGGTELGFAYFATIKLAGYTAFCRYAISPVVARANPQSRILPSIWIAGATRTLIGLGIGFVVGVGFWKIPAFAQHDELPETLFFALLIPVRVGEWILLLCTVYKRFPLPSGSTAPLVVKGIFVSFLLDLLGVVCAFVLPGGAWVC